MSKLEEREVNQSITKAVAKAYLNDGKWTAEVDSGVIVSALSHQNPNVRSMAAIELGKARSEEAVPALCKALAEDPDPRVRQNAAEALGLIGEKEIEVDS